jgi:uncharacterized protein YbjT (DUF2867 family)
MRVLVAGANGAIGQLLLDRLVLNGHDVAGGVRAQEQFSVINARKAKAVKLDLTCADDFGPALEGRDSVIFVAGSGGKAVEDVDRDGTIRLIDAAKKAGIPRFILLSSVYADRPEEGPEKIRPYLRAKHAADLHMLDSGLDFTIVRPGTLTNDQPHDHITLGTHIAEDGGSIPRADVASTLACVLETPGSVGETFEIISGDALISDALADAFEDPAKLGRTLKG